MAFIYFKLYQIFKVEVLFPFGASICVLCSSDRIAHLGAKPDLQLW